MMIGSGGTAIVGKTLGQKNPEKANRYFSMLIYTMLLIGVFTAIIGWFATEPFTALNSGVVSAAISFLRAFVFETDAILLLPMLFGKEAIWRAVVVSELAALLLTAMFLIHNRKKYRYI